MKNITIISPFRDNAHEIPTYTELLKALRWPPSMLRYVFVEGDSIDGTWAALVGLYDQLDGARLVRKSTGAPHYGSVVNKDRFKQLSIVFNAGLVAADLEWSTHILFLPSDIIYAPDLLERLAAHDKDMIAPFVYRDDRFYDIWAFSRNGRNFPPFRRDQARAMWGEYPLRMDTVGCTILMRAEIIAAGARYTPEAVDRGLCEEARRLGYEVWADPTTEVLHPVKVPP